MPLLPDQRIDADVAVIGSGFAGSLTAMCLRRRGRRVVLVERGRHPRFAIGESSTPLANVLLEELADRYDLPRIRAFTKWGTWRRDRPDVACGLKRGFTFFFHNPGEPFADEGDHARQLLVGASPHDAVADTHWYRSAVDHAFVREAEAEGAIYLDETSLAGVTEREGQVVLDGVRHGRSVRIAADFVIDASGPRGFLHRALRLPEAPLRWLAPTQTVYTHFEQVARWDDLMPCGEPPPYPRDDAAVHHVFPGGWIWVLRFSNGVTSAGAALTCLRPSSTAARQPTTGDGAAVWERLLRTLPSVAAQFRHARPALPFVHVPRLAFRSQRVCGANWALLPSAAGVIDPLLSTGFPLTLLGIQRLLSVIEQTSDGPERQAALDAYARVTQRELDVTEQLVASLYATMGDPTVFKRLSLLYFAAASYSEAARRLGRRGLAPGFLLHARAPFGAELRACAAQASAADHRSRDALLARIDQAIEPVDIAGLRDRTRRDWYPMRREDLVAAAPKLNATADDIERLLERCGFTAGRNS